MSAIFINSLFKGSCIWFWEELSNADLHICMVRSLKGSSFLWLSCPPQILASKTGYLDDDDPRLIHYNIMRFINSTLMPEDNRSDSESDDGHDIP
jgi:hypothetical protein